MTQEKSLKSLRQHLRKDMPLPEVLMWQKLKGKQFFGYKFRRQYSVGRYILDFYCPSLKLGIEIDGDTHYDSKGFVENIERTETLLEAGIRIIRFTNREIVENIVGVLELLKVEIFKPPLTPP